MPELDDGVTPYFARSQDPVARINEYPNQQQIDAESLELKKELQVRLHRAETAIPVSYSPRDYQILSSLRSQYFSARELFIKIAEDMDDAVNMEAYRRAAYTRVGLRFLIDDLVQRQINLAQKYPGQGPAIDHLELLKFFYTTPLTVQIGDVTLKDLIDETPSPKKSPLRIFNFFVQVCLHNRYKDYPYMAASNNSYPMNKYPNLAEMKAREAITDALTILEAPLDKPIKERPTARVSEGVELARRVHFFRSKLASKAREFQELMLDALLDYKSPWFSEASEVVKNYLTNSEESRVLALHCLGLSDLSKLRQIYRTSQTMVDTDHDNGFYEMILSSIDDFLQAFPMFRDLPTREVLDNVITNQEGVEDEEVPTPDTLRTAIGQLPIRYLQNPDLVDYDLVNYEAIVPPQSLGITFDKVHSTRFEVALGYENEAGEELDIRLAYDLIKKSFDWSFLEAPTDPRMTRVRAILDRLTLSILEQIRKRYDELKAEEKGKSMLTADVSKPKSEKVHYDRHSADQPVKEAKTPHVVFTPIMRAMQELGNSDYERGVKQIINLPAEQDQLEDLLADIGSNHHARVIEAVHDFNNNGLGWFKMLNTGERASRKWELKVGDIRVIVEPKESETRGVSEFNIFRIWYRSEAFKGKNRRAVRST